MKRYSFDPTLSFRVLHVVPSDGGGYFCSSMVNRFKNEDCGIDISQHLFLTEDPDFYERCHDLCKVICMSQNDLILGINDYGKTADVIFLHGIPWSMMKTLMIKSSLDRKIIWRTWGHDIRIPKFDLRHLVRTVYSEASFILFRRKVRRFKCVGCANIVDILKAQKAFGKQISTCILPYKQPGSYRKYASKAQNAAEKDRPLRIMVGHSGFPLDKHIEILTQLKRFAGSNITVSIPLVYGKPDYIEEVSRFARDTFGDRCEIVRNEVPEDEYAAYINGIDVAVMAMDNSAALGNIGMLVFFKKKIYLSTGGDIAEAFAACGLPYSPAASLSEASLDEIAAPAVYDEEAWAAYCEARLKEDYFAEKWKMIFHNFC